MDICKSHHSKTRFALLVVSLGALSAALAVTMQSKVLEGAIVGYRQSTMRVSEVQQFASQCGICLNKYIACTSDIRKRRDYSDEKIAMISRECTDSYSRCRNRMQCFK